jgi:hypothetical protein
MTDQLGIVQFIHPGKEQTKHRDGWCDWNRAVRSDKAWPHRRKFLLGNASYVSNGSDAQGLVGFWGEWEGPSYVRALARGQSNGKPKCIHIPAFYEPDSYEGRLDTDPFVFGDRFLYNGCQQHTAHHRPGGAVPTFLKKLERGSVILFGSQVSKRFVIDTVFVVADHTEYQRGEYGEIESKVPAEYIHLSLETQAVGNETVKSFRLYTGATFADPVHGMYSFTPCQPVHENRNGFARPTIRMDVIVTQSLTQGKKFSRMESLDDVATKWLDVKRQIEATGCAVAHRIELEPKRVTT